MWVKLTTGDFFVKITFLLSISIFACPFPLPTCAPPLGASHISFKHNTLFKVRKGDRQREKEGRKRQCYKKVQIFFSSSSSFTQSWDSSCLLIHHVLSLKLSRSPARLSHASTSSLSQLSQIDARQRRRRHLWKTFFDVILLKLAFLKTSRQLLKSSSSSLLPQLIISAGSSNNNVI